MRRYVCVYACRLSDVVRMPYDVLLRLPGGVLRYVLLFFPFVLQR
jgi:hypothetical protein